LAYEERGQDGGSWFQAEPAFSLEFINSVSGEAHASIIDVGGGTSLLVDRLVEQGRRNVTVLDVSNKALGLAAKRLGTNPAVTWLHQNLTTWSPERTFDVWHDRAVFHFLVEPNQRETYLNLVRSCLSPGGGLVMAAFDIDGPHHCSGLPISRYRPNELAELLRPHFTVQQTRREEWVQPTLNARRCH